MNNLVPWGFSPPLSDQLLDWERIIANKRVGTLEMRVRLEAGDVKPKHLGVTLPDFTEWALPYILLRDEDTGWAGWHDIEGLERVCHTQDLADHEQRPVQFLLTKPFCEAQTYSPPVIWLPHCFSACVAGCLQARGHGRLPGMTSAHPWGCMWRLCSMG